MSEGRLTHHQLSHAQPSNNTRPLTCDVCQKKFMNNSALACHMKIHSEEKYYSCPMCRQGYDMMVELKKHVEVHRINGFFPCSHCHKSFADLGHYFRLYFVFKPHFHLLFAQTASLNLLRSQLS